MLSRRIAPLVMAFAACADPGSRGDPGDNGGDCVALTCTAGQTCGVMNDGCGGTVNCGNCTPPFECGVGGVDNVCACVPRGCTPGECSRRDNGCGVEIDCGGCSAPQSCGGGGVPHWCGCTARTCVPQVSCGQVDDGCGLQLNCGHCAAPNSCGGGGVPSTCGCTPDVIQCTSGFNCGAIPDGCGHDVDCGACPPDFGCVYNFCDPAYDDVGEPCLSASECSGVACLAGPPDGDYVGGYCTGACNADDICGADNHCWYAGTPYSMCVKGCSDDNDCRGADHYRCYDADGDGSKECQPVAWGAGEVGAPCTSKADCKGDTLGACGTEAGGFREGYCVVVDCVSDADCQAVTAGSHCAVIDPNTGKGLCFASCTDTVTDAECRSDGYRCYDFDGDAVNECMIAGTGTGRIGDPCLGSWECIGEELGFCAPDYSGWWSGYCLAYCAPTADPMCPTGSHCVDYDWNDVLTGSDMCMDDCSFDATGTPQGDCREHYWCLSIDALFDQGIVPECTPMSF